MGWLFKAGSTRRDLIEERTKDWTRDGAEGITVTTTCLAHCYRGNVYSGVLWAVWERKFVKDGQEAKPTERWITCDLLRHQRDCGWGYKDMDESMYPYYFSCPLKYLDLVPIEASLRRTGRLLVCEEGTETGGWGTEVIGRVTSQAFETLRCAPARLASRMTPIANSPTLEKATLPDEAQIMDAVRQLMENKTYANGKRDAA